MNKNNSDEKEVYQKLIRFGKSKATPDILIPKVVKYINYPSKKIKAKVLWMLGELGLKNPEKIEPYIIKIAHELKNEDAKIRQRAVGALGRIGRGNFGLIKPYISTILSKTKDPIPDVRMNCIWACENIATTYPDIFSTSMEIFARLLDDPGIRVRRESPEIFRVIGKKFPDFVAPYIPKLKTVSETDPDNVVRIHAAGAIKASTT
ncbi:MAG: HEAT repeat domain-containing protein [Clostridia bacterium]|nr:HEAT repeat domain-containing protein [Clostridia bacterium]